MTQILVNRADCVAAVLPICSVMTIMPAQAAQVQDSGTEADVQQADLHQEPGYMAQEIAASLRYVRSAVLMCIHVQH